MSVGIGAQNHKIYIVVNLLQKNGDDNMTNEAVIIELFDGGRPIRFTCDEANTILKGTLLELSGDRTVIANTNDNAPVVGIAAAEKVGGDGSTTISAYTDGIFDMLSDAGTDVVGSLMANSATENELQTGDAADLLSGAWVGYMIEAGTNAGTEAIRINK